LKKLLCAFYKRNLAFFNLAIISNLEYRFNFFIDAVIQPLMVAGTEVLLWTAIFLSSAQSTIGGFGVDSYLAYALWAAFFSRISTNWMYEFRMIEEVSSGTLNSLLVRPMSFYEYYLSQLLGYKFVVTFISIIFPLAASFIFKLPLFIERLPLVLLLSFYYLLLVHSISFFISNLAFYFTKISSMTVAKNLLLWILMGELFPLDLLPTKVKEILCLLPFASGVYVPISYLTGRIDSYYVQVGFVSITISLVIINALAYFMWNRSLREYTGTGA